MIAQTSTNPKLLRLARALASELEQRQAGHCLRIDHLQLAECQAACIELRRLIGDETDAFVLSHTEDNLHIPVDRAIELRNRKRKKLCIFVPADLQDVAASSLGNSFSTFRLHDFLQGTVETMLSAMDEERRELCSMVRKQLRGAARVPLEREIDYLCALEEDSRVEAVGENLWRVGLIPDLRESYEEFARDIEINRLCVERLVRPLKPQASLIERIQSLQLKPNTIQAKLLKFLQGRRLASDDEWMREILDQPDLSFDKWAFPDFVPSDLESVTVEPFHEGGKLKPGTGLKQDAPGTVPYAPCGPKCKIKIKWSPEPTRPRDVGEWLVEMLPNPEEHPGTDPDSVDLPKKRVKGSATTATLSMDFDLESIEVRSVVVRVTALDFIGAEIRDADSDEPIRDESQPFYLEEYQETSSGTTKRLPTERCLADAYLAVALRTKDKELRHTFLPPFEKDLLYLPVQINDRYIARIATTGFLRELENDILASPSVPYGYVARASDVEPLARAHASGTPIDLGSLVEDKLWREFSNARKRLFEHLRSQECRSFCVVHFSPDVCECVVRLAKAYVALCNEIATFADDDPARFRTASELLVRMDCLEIIFSGRQGPACVTVHLPSHPARLLWAAAYSEWVQSLADAALSTSPQARRKLIDPQILRHVSPDNLPAWTVRPGAKPSYFFDNVHFAYGVSLPTGTPDPAALFALATWTLGFGEPDSRLVSVESPRLADQVRRYRILHPYVSSLRVAAVNTGSGNFLTSALLEAMRPTDGPDTEDNACRLELLHCLRKEDIIPRAEAERFLGEWQRSSAYSVSDHLRPSVQVGLLRLNTDEGMPGDDVHLTVLLDSYAPELKLRPRPEKERDQRLYGASSLGLFGLLTRLESDFETDDSAAAWWHQLCLDGVQNAGDHPVRPVYTKLISDVHESHQMLGAALLGASPSDGRLPALCTEVDAEGLQMMGFFHQNSDWVLSVDRHFGVEFYDSPNDVHQGRNFERYLLDYVPEFIEGMGHRQIITTKWSEEITPIMQRAMAQLGFSGDVRNCLQLLRVLKTLSGRLALRLASEDSLAQETIGLAVAAAYMIANGDLMDAIVVPLDAHKGFFLEAKKNEQVDTASRCDLLVVRGVKNRLKVEFIEVKSRSVMGSRPSDLLDRIADQTHRTEQLFRSVFFPEKPRFDTPIQRCRLASVLRFYLSRARRHGRISSEESFDSIMDAIGRVETGQSKLISGHRGYIVNLGGPPSKSFTHQDTQIVFLSGPEIEKSTGISVSVDPKKADSSALDPSNEELGNMEDGPQETSTEQAESSIKATTVDLVSPFEESTEASPNETEGRPNDDASEVVIDLGDNVRTEQPVQYVGSVSGSPHLFVIGIPGQGKSWTMQRLVLGCASQGVPSIILDFHGQFGDSNGVVAKHANPLVFDAVAGLPFSPFEANLDHGPAHWKTNAFQVAEIIEHVFDLGEMQRDVLYEAIRDAYFSTGFASGEGPLPTMGAVFKKLQHREGERKGVRNTTARCRPLFEFNLFNESGDRAVTFAEAYARGMVVDLHGLGLEVLQNAAGAFVLRKLYKDMFSWGESKRLRLMVVLDEAHRLAKDTTLPKLMKEGRKFGIGVMVASQSVQDFHPEVLENAGTKIAYRLNHPQNRHVSAFFRPSAPGEDLADTLASLEVGQALVQTPHMPSAVKVGMYPLT